MILWERIVQAWRFVFAGNDLPVMKGVIATIHIGSTQTEFTLVGDSTTYVFIEWEFDPRYAHFDFAPKPMMGIRSLTAAEDGLIACLVRELMGVDQIVVQPIEPGMMIEYRLSDRQTDSSAKLVDIFRRAQPNTEPVSITAS